MIRTYGAFLLLPGASPTHPLLSCALFNPDLPNQPCREGDPTIRGVHLGRGCHGLDEDSNAPLGAFYLGLPPSTEILPVLVGEDERVLKR